VLVKIGHFNSKVWVTKLATGEAIDQAEIIVYTDRYQNMVGPQKVLVKAYTDQDGLAQLPGSVDLDPSLQWFKYWYEHEDERLFVKVTKGNDIAVVALDDHYEVNTYRVSGGFASFLGQKHV